MRNLTFCRNFMILLIAVMVGCSSADKLRAPNNPDPLIKGEVTEDKARRALEMKLAKQIDFLEQNKENYKNQVVALPAGDTKFYYKYYDEFPEGPEGLDISVTPTDSFNPSYRAEAKYRKVRYQTRYSRSHGKAANDNDFIRDQGIQTDVFEFNGQTWQLRSSVFDVTRTSVYSEEGWTVTKRRINRVEQEKPEYFVDKVRTLFGLLD